MCNGSAAHFENQKIKFQALAESAQAGEAQTRETITT